MFEISTLMTNDGIFKANFDALSFGGKGEVVASIPITPMPGRESRLKFVHFSSESDYVNVSQTLKM